LPIDFINHYSIDLAKEVFFVELLEYSTEKIVALTILFMDGHACHISLKDSVVIEVVFFPLILYRKYIS
jgi:hypothetical protein